MAPPTAGADRSARRIDGSALRSVSAERKRSQGTPVLPSAVGVSAAASAELRAHVLREASRMRIRFRADVTTLLTRGATGATRTRCPPPKRETSVEKKDGR